MSDVFFTADTHFGHGNCIKFCNRPFNSVEEMDDALISNWNSVIDKSSIVYHLGDFSFNGITKYTERLNGNIHLIIGNHDRRKLCDGNFCSIQESRMLNIGEEEIFLSHFSHRVWNKSHFNVPMLFGHSHGTLSSYGKSFDCGVDTHNYFPYSWEEVKEILKNLPDNPNIVKSKY